MKTPSISPWSPSLQSNPSSSIQPPKFSLLGITVAETSTNSSKVPFMSPTALNSSAREWSPTPLPHLPPYQHLLPHLVVAPQHQPGLVPLLPQTAVQVVPFVTAPPPEAAGQFPGLTYYHSPSFFSFRGFIPYAPSTLPQPDSQVTVYSFPANGCSHEAATPVSGGAEEIVVDGIVYANPDKENLVSPTEIPEENRPNIRSTAKNQPVAVIRRMSFPPRLRRLMKSLRLEKETIPRREWKPKEADYEPVLAGGAVASPQIPPPPSKLLAAFHPVEELSSSSKTTVMVKNVPNQLRRDFMLEFLDRICREYSLEYDFLYLPMDFRKEDNLGYAFVNFTTAGAALKFKVIMHNYKWDTVSTKEGIFTSKKVCEITWGRIQGLDGLAKRFENSYFACDKSDFLPVVLDPPRNGSDPQPAPPVVLGRLLHPRATTKICGSLSHGCTST